MHTPEIPTSPASLCRRARRAARRPARSIRSGRRRGFTLIEVLAALLLIGIVLPVIMQGFSIATRVGSTAKRRTEAGALADAKLTELVATAQWQSGMISRRFQPRLAGVPVVGTGPAVVRFRRRRAGPDRHLDRPERAARFADGFDAGLRRHLVRFDRQRHRARPGPPAPAPATGARDERRLTVQPEHPPATGAAVAAGGRAGRRGFTLLELLVAIVLMVIVAIVPRRLDRASASRPATAPRTPSSRPARRSSRSRSSAERPRVRRPAPRHPGRPVRRHRVHRREGRVRRRLLLFHHRRPGPRLRHRRGEADRVLAYTDPTSGEHLLVRRVTGNLLSEVQQQPDEEVLCRNVGPVYAHVLRRHRLGELLGFHAVRQHAPLGRPDDASSWSARAAPSGQNQSFGSPATSRSPATTRRAPGKWITRTRRTGTTGTGDGNRPAAPARRAAEPGTGR